MKNMIKEVTNLNQICKGFNSDSTYIIRNGEVLSHSFSNKKNSCYIRMRRSDGEPILSDEIFVGVNGQELYQFIKTSKENKTPVVLVDVEKHLLRVANERTSYYAKFDKSVNNFYKEVKRGIKNFKRKDCKTIDITEEVISALNNNLPIIINNGDIRLRFSKKFIKIRYTDKIEDVKMHYHYINDELFIVNIEVEKDNYIIEHMFYAIRF